MQTDAVLRVVSVGAHQLLAVIDKLYGNLCLGLRWWERVGPKPDFSTDTASIVDVEGFSSGAVTRMLAVNEDMFILNGWQKMRVWDGSKMRDAGADPAPAPTLASGGNQGVDGAGNDKGLTGDYSAVFTYYDSARGFETNPAQPAPALVTLANQSLRVTVVASTDTRFDKIRIYRNQAGVPATFFLDQEVANASATIESVKADVELGGAVSYGNARPPVCMYIAKTASRIFWGGSRPWTSGTATVRKGETTVTLSEEPPQDLYTRNAEWPFYFSLRNGSRHVITAIAGKVLTLGGPFVDDSATDSPFVITGLTTRVCYADIGALGLAKPECWNPNNYFNVGLQGDAPHGGFSEEITGMIEHGNRMFAFLRWSIWYFDPQISAVKRTMAEMGLASDRTLAKDKDGNWTFVGSDQQVYAFNGMSTARISDKVGNRFADKDRYNSSLMEFAHSYTDAKEKLLVVHRPAAESTLLAMRFLVDVYDDHRGEWTDRNAPRITATTRVRDVTREMIVGVDTMGLCHVVDAYEISSTFGKDRFSGAAPTVFTSIAGEISPGANRKGKVAVVFTDAGGVKGSKLIVNTASTGAVVEDLIASEAVTVAAGDKYLVGAWHARYDTGQVFLRNPDLFKRLYYIEGTWVAGSQGFLWVSVYVNERTTPSAIVKVTAGQGPYFKRMLPARGRSFRLVLDVASELSGLALREISLGYQLCGPV